MYKLGNIDLDAFGLIPSQIDGSNLAVSGCWDMPARMGKVSHDWGDDADSIEPYLRPEEIRFAGRDIVFVALMETDTEATALAKCYDLYKQLGGINTLVPFIADNLGTFQVYLKESIVADYIGDGWCKLKFTFREPVVDLTGTVPAPTNAELGIDGISFKDLNIIPLDVTGRFNNPAPKNFKSTFYANEGYKVSKLQSREVTIKTLVQSSDYTGFKNTLKGLYALFKKEGVRYITYRSDAFRDFFVANGFQVTNVLQFGNGQITAELSVKFTEVSARFDWSFLIGSDGTPLLDALGQKIIIFPPVEQPSETVYSIAVSSQSVNIEALETEVEITVTSNVEWTVLEGLSWATLSDSLGLGNGSFVIEVDANTTANSRTGTIIVSSRAGNKAITITQAKATTNTLSITTLQVSAGSTANTYNVTVNVANPDNYVLEYRVDAGAWKTSNLFSDIVVGSRIFDVRNKNIITFTATKTQVIGTVITPPSGTAGVLSDFPLTPETHWNRFQPDLIPDFDIPKRVDSRTGMALAVKGLFWHTPYKDNFGATQEEQFRKMFKKGIVAINATKLGAYYVGMENVITGDRIIVDDGLGADANGNKRAEELSYDAFAAFAKRCFGYANTYKQLKGASGKWKVFLAIVDYENYYTKMSTQEDANYHVVAFEAGLGETEGLYAFQYGGGLNHGGYATSNLYNGGANNIWTLAADTTVPVVSRGKSLASNNRHAACVEVSFTFEALLPQGYQTKDQNGNNWIVINHFGNECDNTYGYSSVTNAEHWATQLGAIVEQSYAKHSPFNQDLIMQLKPVNERDNGFHYSSIHPEYADGKWIQEYNRYGIQYFERDGNGNILSSQLNAIGSEYLPNFISEAQVYLAFFSGARWINWWSSAWAETAIARLRSANARRGNREDDKTYGNADLEGYTYTMKALYQLSRKITLSNGSQYSFYDICDGTEIYLNQTTKVIYAGSSTPQQLTALQWQLNTKSPVRAVVNKNLAVVFVLAFQAYASEQGSVTFVYTADGNNISEVIDIPAGTIAIRAFPLGVASTPTVTAPAITSVPARVLAGQSVTFSSANTGTISWFKNGTSLSVTGANYTVENPSLNDEYTAKRTVNSVISGASNVIKVESATVNGVTFIEPQKPTYYFSDGKAPSFYDNVNNLPAIFTNQPRYDPFNDIVWMNNDFIKIGINLKRGGQLMWVSEKNSTENLVYNGYDGGFQITIDAYQKPDGYTQAGQVSHSAGNNQGSITSYNTTMGGDFFNHSQSLIDYKRIGDSYYVKFRPIFYTFDALFSEVIIEVKYTLNQRSVAMEVTYHSFRTDNQQNVEGGFDGAAFPACFIVNTLNRYQCYTGANPWIGDDVEDGQLQIINQGGSVIGRNCTEYWSSVYRNRDNKAIGLYSKQSGNSVYSQMKQLEVYQGNGEGTEFGGGFTYFDLFHNFNISNRGDYIKTLKAYITTGTKEQVRAEFRRLHELGE